MGNLNFLKNTQADIDKKKKLESANDILGNKNNNVGKMINDLTIGKIEEINIDDLEVLPDQAFEEYSGERFDDLMNNIEEIGLQTPLIVEYKRNEDKKEVYLILAGRHRYKACKRLFEAGNMSFAKVPCIIKKGLSDEDRTLIINSTNLYQRSFTDMTLHERCRALYESLNAVKIKHEKLSPDEKEKLKGKRTIEELGDLYSIQKSQLSKYIKIYKSLYKELYKYADNGRLNIKMCYGIATLPVATQKQIKLWLDENKDIEFNIDKINQIIDLSNNNKLNDSALDKVLNHTKDKVETYKINKTTFDRFKMYFGEKPKNEIVEATIIKALEEYFKNHK